MVTPETITGKIKAFDKDFTTYFQQHVPKKVLDSGALISKELYEKLIKKYAGHIRHLGHITKPCDKPRVLNFLKKEHTWESVKHLAVYAAEQKNT